MKRFLLFVIVGLLAFSAPMLLTSCSTAPSARVAQVQTLKAVGESAEAAVTSAAHLYASGQITAQQTLQVMQFYDQKFQPAYRVAVTAVNSNLTLQAPDDLVLLSAQLSALLLQFTTHK